MIDFGARKTRDDATPHTRGGKHAAARTVGLLGGVFTFAMDRDPCRTSLDVQLLLVFRLFEIRTSSI